MISIPDLSVYPRIYQRQDAPSNLEENSAEIIIVGDIFCGREGKSLGLSLEDVSAWLQRADLTIGNLECVISSLQVGGRSGKLPQSTGPFLLHGAPWMAGYLRQAGFDTLGLANNHALDLGVAGLADTLQYLKLNGVHSPGVRWSRECTSQIEISRVGELKIVILATNAIQVDDVDFIPGQQEKVRIEDWHDQTCLFSKIQAARQEADAVIVLVHWGVEYENRASFSQQAIAKELIAAGADLVVGSHPHVPQQVEIYPSEDGKKDAVVAYSLGNFMADQEFGDTVHGLALRVFVDEQGISAVQALPVQAGSKPKLMDIEKARDWLGRILPETEPISFACTTDTCQEIGLPTIGSKKASGFFWSGEIDLTGDGILEFIQRQAGIVKVYQNGIEDWQSPENWRIVDLALGDPDHDGRQEMMLAFWRADKTGTLRSHPFIVGYRGGTYQETWGGSGVSDPIAELELGDVDGDGLEELVVLEQRLSGQQAVTVWDWHGWGFSLKWRSPEGKYENLQIFDDPPFNRKLIIVSQLTF
jgi:poly-gamma-glutamate synthesis protein (capsule biosynthesis protein)